MSSAPRLKKCSRAGLGSGLIRLAASGWQILLPSQGLACSLLGVCHLHCRPGFASLRAWSRPLQPAQSSLYVKEVPGGYSSPGVRAAHRHGSLTLENSRPGPRQSSTCLPIPSTQVHSGVLTRNRGVTATELGARRAQPPSAKEERPPHSTPTGTAPPLWSTPRHQRPVRATHILLTQCPTVVALGRPRAAPKCLDSHVPALCVSP